MRLKQIKLSGFKSFVDPTHLEVPGRLVGIVGPNGCGKSNIMDAVRWVLGESRAHELRGESMQDVIFSGSADRKPAGRASVELVFDNSLGRIGGAWGQFTEVAVRRVLSRDGQSSYSINQQLVRRRDVHDLFLGTGLGPRAYAIIGQGTIARIIESRPEDLRVFLEEAAGVSRYKERRRETEQRLADTRANLTRVEDLLRELQDRVDRLEEQAAKARQHAKLQAARALHQGLLWLSRSEEAREKQQRFARRKTEHQLNLEEALAKLRAAEARLEGLRSAVQAANDAMHLAQGQYYQASSELGRCESELRHLAEAKQRAGQQLAGVDAQCALHRNELAEQESRSKDSAQRLEALEASLLDLDARVVQWRSQEDVQREGTRLAQQEVDEARNALEFARSAHASARIRASAAEQQMRQLEGRRDRAKRALAALHPPATKALEESAKTMARAETELEQCGQREHELALSAAEAGLRARQAEEALRTEQLRLAEVEAQCTALQQLEERIGQESELRPWLRDRGWEDFPRIWQRMRIEPGWESAIEAVLRERVESIELPDFSRLAALPSEHCDPPGKQAFFSLAQILEGLTCITGAPHLRLRPTARESAETGAAQTRPSSEFFDQAVPEGVPAPYADLKPLPSLVFCADPSLAALLEQWLESYYAASDLADALGRQARLAPGICLITPQGHQIERHSVRLYASDQVQEGRLARHRELEQLQRAVKAQRLMSEACSQRSTLAERQRGEADTLLEKARGSHLQAARLTADRRLADERLRQEAHWAQAECSRLEVELAEINRDVESARLAIPSAESLNGLAEKVEERVRILASQRSALEQALDTFARWQEATREAERERDACKAEARVLHERLEASRLRCAVLKQSIEMLEKKRAELFVTLEAIRDESVRNALQRALEERLAAEQRLGDRRQQAETLALQCRESDEHRLSMERVLQPLRDAIAAVSLEEQAALLGAEQFDQFLREAGQDSSALRAQGESFGIMLQPASLQIALNALTQELSALGAVNLAALEELASTQERKSFVESQSADLRDAMGVLEDAIRRIDRETRALLRETYDQVNLNFGRLFPRLFGGGEARLLLSGEEILDAGIQVIAQPPGKRNSSIQVLSGGEKALTAIALVFSIFQLNPAPFCLLDEVDAPLDDANTERYCDIVRAMSEQTQFLFITHNKVAMELAEQLVGVTMQERGVSRLVAVDLESAAGYAEAA